MRFTEYKNLDLVEINRSVLKRWNQEETFVNTLEKRKGASKFIFFEGPPSANGMPGIHHVMARAVKDVICRYKSQKGFLVERKAGWDTHGLPVELGVEKKLGITKEDIGKTVSVEQYNSVCRKEVMKYTREWEQLTELMGYWVDMNNPYITYDNRYIETLWHLLKQIYQKGLLYKGYSIQPYSPAAGTGLSTHELNQPGCYKDVKDTTCVAQFKIVRDQESEWLFDRSLQDAYFLAWTTTPWTLPSNTALCVGPSINYARVISANPYTGRETLYILAEDLIESHFPGKIPFNIVERSIKGDRLCGVKYHQLIPWVNPGDGAFRVIPGDFVTTSDGTGIVHIAPTFGADDDRAGRQNGVPPLMVRDRDGIMQAMVDKKGRFYPVEELDPEFLKDFVNTELYREYAGRYVKNAYDPDNTNSDTTLDIDLAVMLKQQGLAFKIEKQIHSYPHCWRTDKPVLYYPLDSWFIKTTAVQKRMIELNSQINWKPEATGSGRFGKWLENLQDWNLSRSRYWGTPLPIWRTEDGKEEKIIGNLTELFQELDKSVAAGFQNSNPLRDMGFVPGDYSAENYEKIDLHRPYVDSYILVSPAGREMYREKDLIDVWFDSGAMPYAQVGLEKLGTEEFGPTADFIAEGVDQTRGWFFTLHAISTMVSDKLCFRNVISNGLVLDRDGNKMSKRLGNTVDPFETLNKYGADALRWYMLTNSQPWDNLKFDEAGVDEVRRKFFGTLFNTYSFFALYANVDGFVNDREQIPIEDRPEIDRWIISLLNTLVKEVDEAFNDYDITTAARKIQDFVTDNLSNWYVRLNRKRFWGGSMDADKLSAYQTLYTCLETIAIIAAPVAPFFMEQLYRDISAVRVPDRGTCRVSVHETLFPQADPSDVDIKLQERMELAQRASSMILALRRKVNIKVRQPLSRILIPVTDEELKNQLNIVKGLILNEVNVKEMEFIYNTRNLVTKKIKPNFKTLGKKYGKQMKEISNAFANFTQEQILNIEEQDQYVLNLPSGDVTINQDDREILSEDMPGWLVAVEGSLTVALDINVTESLSREGVARELVNRIQNLRKDNGFEVTDKIRIEMTAREEIKDSLDEFREYVCQQTLATDIQLTGNDPENGAPVEWDEGTLVIRLEKVKKQK